MNESGHNGLVERVAHELKRSIKIDPSFDESVMAEVRRHGKPAMWVRVIAWWRRPQQLSLSPLSMAASAAVLILAVAVSPVRFGNPDGVEPIAEDPAARVIRFELDAPRASSVTLSGDFNDWDLEATPMTRTSSGEWVTTVKLVPGRYEYTFVVDGDKWVPDPAAPPSLFDDFGGTSSTITVPEV